MPETMTQYKAQSVSDLENLQAALLSKHGLKLDNSEVKALMNMSQGSIHVDVPLTNLAMSIPNRDFIADAVLPVVQVNKDSDKYWKFDPGTFFEEQNVTLVGPMSKPGMIRWVTSTGNYSTVDYGIMDFVSNREKQNADAPLLPQMSATKICVNRLNLARERRVAAIVFGSGNYGSNTAALSGTDRWDNASSDPTQKILDAIESCDVRPNTLVMGAEVWLKLQTNAKLLNMIQSRGTTSLGPTPMRPTLQMVAQAFELDNVVVGRAKYRSNREGLTAASSYVWGKSAALIYVQPTPDPRETQAFGYTFRSASMETQTFEDPMPGRSGGTWVKVTHSDDEVTIAGSYAGYLYTTVVS